MCKVPTGEKKMEASDIWYMYRLQFTAKQTRIQVKNMCYAVRQKKCKIIGRYLDL